MRGKQVRVRLRSVPLQRGLERLLQLRQHLRHEAQRLERAMRAVSTPTAQRATNRLPHLCR
jgi:hypothetical protein